MNECLLVLPSWAAIYCAGCACAKWAQLCASIKSCCTALLCCAVLHGSQAPGNDGTNDGSIRQWEGADDENDDCNIDATMGGDTTGKDGSNGLEGVDLNEVPGGGSKQCNKEYT